MDPYKTARSPRIEATNSRVHNEADQERYGRPVPKQIHGGSLSPPPRNFHPVRCCELPIQETQSAAGHARRQTAAADWYVGGRACPPANSRVNDRLSRIVGSRTAFRASSGLALGAGTRARRSRTGSTRGAGRATC